MTRRALLLPCLFAVLAQLSAGCYCCRPFLGRWCGADPCCSPCGGGAAYASPVTAGPGCSSCASASPIASTPIHTMGGPVAMGYPPVGVQYAPPSVFTGPATPIVPPPQVQK